MRTRSSSNLVGNSSSNPTTSNPKRRNRRRSKQPFSLEESPVVTMADQRTMAELLRAPTEGYAEAIVVPPILAEHFELKHSLINMMTSDQFFGLEKDNPHDHIPTSPPASVKAVEEICVTCGGAHPYYLCVAADGNTFPEYRDNIQGYVAASNDGNYKSGISDALSRPYNEDKNVKKITNASLILEDFNPPLYELPFHKEVPGLRILLSFSSKNEENVFNPGILTSKRVHTSFLPELSHRGPKAFKVIKIFESPMEIFPCSHGENIPYLDVPCSPLSFSVFCVVLSRISRILEASRARGFVLRSQELHILSCILGIQYPNLID
ncbi:hypothetical protein Tco_0819498 [Tanacetum coccineum]|uniref:Reverse transcriptase domain-containing protein n=1 Tax=Tanacetum coccineum TaxID=301880 RepID=A0ABQ5ABD7_9ASTR